VLDRIVIVRRESLKRLDDDIDILKTYLKAEDAPKAAIDALEALTVDQLKSWKAAIEMMKKALE
jgi:hypothetical protein